MCAPVTEPERSALEPKRISKEEEKEYQREHLHGTVLCVNPDYEHASSSSSSKLKSSIFLLRYYVSMYAATLLLESSKKIL